ncbi:MAG: cca 1 [Phycisphaerales bacterium]|nr:cca 1 [Phycisphaerales bacterium]
MADERTRKHIALLAARLMYDRQETEYFTAKRKAARQLGIDSRYRPKDLPSNAEIRDQIQAFANLIEGNQRQDNLKEMRLAAFAMMRRFDSFHPRLIGSVWTGHIRQGSDIDLHLFCNHLSAITTVLDEQNLRYTVEHKRVVKHNEARTFTHVHVSDRFEFELTIYPTEKINYVFKSSITGRAIERATLPELEQFLASEYPEVDLTIDGLTDIADRYELFRMLLAPLESVKQSPVHHPEGDALYHSLQVFHLARDRVPYDEGFLLAALLHDVGKAIDPADHVAAGVAALEDSVTPRTLTLIAGHMEAHAYNAAALGHRARQRFREAENFDDLMLLAECDKAGRRRGVEVCTIAEALTYIRDMADAW